MLWNSSRNAAYIHSPKTPQGRVATWSKLSAIQASCEIEASSRNHAGCTACHAVLAASHSVLSAVPSSCARVARLCFVSGAGCQCSRHCLAPAVAWQCHMRSSLTRPPVCPQIVQVSIDSCLRSLTTAARAQRTQANRQLAASMRRSLPSWLHVPGLGEHLFGPCG